MSFQFDISPIVTDIKPSGIRKYFDLVGEMEGAISLGIGEPDFVTPWHIRDAGILSLEKGQTHYTANAGLMGLRREICRYMSRRFSLDYAENEVLVTVGGSEAIDLCIRALICEGDEVLIPEPCFVCYDPCVRLAHGVPVPIVTEEKDDFILTPEKLKEKITPRTKLLVLPYPNNPTGAIMTKAQLEAIAEVLKDTNIAILSDEIYAELTYSEKHCSIANIPGMKERTIIVSGFSKTYAMTGWRLGYAAANSELIKMMTKIHQFAIMSAPTNSQYAAIEALKNGDEDIAEMASQYDERRRFLIDRLNGMGLHCFEAKGAFYVFPSIQSTGLSSEEFCNQFLAKKKVAVIPGTAFGNSGEGYVRISYAYSIETIQKAMDRLEEFLQEFSK